MNSLLLTNKGQLGSRTNRGSIVIFVVLMMPLLLGIMGIALDMGKLFVVKSELQNAADACALAAAYELDGTGSQFTRAESAGITLATANRTLFQKEAVAATADTSVQFSTTATGGYTPKGGAAATAGFVRCTLARNNMDNWFVQLLGLGNQNMSAVAVASNLPGQNTCSLPIGLCNTQVTTSTPVGTWLEGVQTAQGANEKDGSFNGYFKWIDFTAGGGGAQELKDLLSDANSCNINTTLPNLEVGEFGLKSAADAHYNTRFGMYAEGAKTGVPDLSGYAYTKTSFTAAFNAYPDFVANQRTNNTQYQGDKITKLNTQPGLKTVLPPNELSKQGTNRRVAVAPVINCKTKIIQRYACLFLLHPMNTGPIKKGDDDKMYIEYLGDANSNGPCKAFAFAGSSNGTGPRVSALVQ